MDLHQSDADGANANEEEGPRQCLPTVFSMFEGAGLESDGERASERDDEIALVTSSRTMLGMPMNSWRLTLPRCLRTDDS